MPLFDGLDDYEAGRCADCTSHAGSAECANCEFEHSTDVYSPAMIGAADLSYLPQLEAERVTLREWYWGGLETVRAVRADTCDPDAQERLGRLEVQLLGCAWAREANPNNPDYLPKLEAERITAEWKTRSARHPSDLTEAPLFGGKKQGEMF